MKIRNKTIMTLISLALFIQAHEVLATSCTVSTTSMNFGSYNVFSSTANSTYGTITVTCSPSGSPYTIALNGGLHGTINQRFMTQGGGSDSLTYGVYIDPTHSTNWGDGTGSSVTVSNTTASPIQVYGLLPASQDVSAGNYSDMLNVTVTF